MRAFRPSAFAEQEAQEEQAEQARKANVTRYQKRAQAGLPLFEARVMRMGPTAYQPRIQTT